MKLTLTQYKQQNKQKYGFTIVELLIVIVVIAILAAISIVAYNGIQSRATDGANLSNTNTIAKAIAAYRIDNNDIPPLCSGGSGSSCLLSSISSTLVPNYVSQLPNDSSTNYPYMYVGAASYDGVWSIRMYKRQISAYCKYGVYPPALDTWWSSAPKC